MRTHSSLLLRLVSGLVAVLAALPALPGAAATLALDPPSPACVTADAPCKESMPIGADASVDPAGPYTFWYYRSYSLFTYNANITRAVIVTHGQERNAADYFGSAVTALQNANDPTLLIIAPHFKGSTGSTQCNDSFDDPSELHWSCTGQGSIYRWDDGGQARDIRPNVIYSFNMIDDLIGLLSDSTVFPNLTKITVSGHSAGGQFTQRYAAGNQSDSMGLAALSPTRAAIRPTRALRAPVSGVLGRNHHLKAWSRKPLVQSNLLGTTTALDSVTPSIKYVVANPGSYMYVDNQRLLSGYSCFENNTCTPGAEFTVNWDPTAPCGYTAGNTYNNYKYGLDARTYGYMNSTRPGLGDPDVKRQYTLRNVAYVLGSEDQYPNAQFDTSCEANAQGSHLALDGSGLLGGRRERGTIFWYHMRQLGAAHTLSIANWCGHDGKCMYTSAAMVQALLF